MKVFLPIATTQNLIIRARRNAALVDIHLRQELVDNTTILSGLVSGFSNGWLVIPLSHNFVEGESYEIEVFDTECIWRGNAFITAQDPETYKLNA